MKKMLCLAILVFLLFSCPKQQVTMEQEIPITTTSDEALQLFLQGREYFENLKFPEAANLFDQAIQKDSNFAKAYLYRAYSGGGYRIYRNNLAKAVELMDKVSEGEKHEILYSQADADGDGATQKAELDKLLESFPNDKRVHDYTGNYYYYTVQDYDKALEHYQRTIEIDPDYPPVYNSMAYLYTDMDNYGEAEKTFQKYIELIPDEPNPYDSYAELLLKQGKYDEAIKQYEKSYETDSSFAMALSGMGDCYLFKGEYGKAREYYRQYFDEAANLNQKVGALFYKANSYIYEGKIEEAIAGFKERATFALENNSPNYVISSYNMAVFALDEAGKFEKGKEYLEKVENFINTADLNEADRNTYKFNHSMNSCYHSIMTDNLESAETEASKCKEIAEKRQNPDEMQMLHLFLGMLETKKKNYEQALTHLSKADMEMPYVWFWMAIAQQQKGEVDEANKLFKKVVNCNENRFDLAIIRQKAKDKAI